MRWNDIEEIAKTLEENYQDENIDNLKLNDLHDLVVSLYEFDDDVDEYNERILNAILEEWMQIRNR